MSERSFVETQISIASAPAYPMVVPVLIRDDQVTLWAAYRSSQGKRAGRKSDFDHCYRLGGLFVEDTVPPESGVIVYVDSIEQVELPDLDRLVWGPNVLQQALVTDGHWWVAWVRGVDGRFVKREQFSSPSLTDDTDDMVPMGRPVQEMSFFQQKLKRSLLPWARIDEPEILARYAVSLMESLFLKLELADVVNDFMEVLENDVGVSIGGQNRHETAAYLLVAIAVLERIADALARNHGLPLSTTMPDGLASCIEQVRLPENEFPVNPFTIVAERLAKDLSPGRIGEFCKAYWNGSPNGGLVWAAVSSLTDVIADSHIAFLRSRLSSEMPLFTGFDDDRISWLDPHAGTGTLFVRGLYGGKNGHGVRGTAIAIEPSPLKFFLLRLRVVAALADLKQNGAASSVRLILANPLIHPEVLKALPDSPLSVVASDLRISEEKWIHIAGKPELTEKFRSALRDIWGMSAFDEDDGVAQYAALMGDFLLSRKHAAALVFAPRAWLDDDAFAAARMAWGNAGDVMHVTSLPEDFSPIKKVRKTGLVSLSVLRLLGGEALKASGLDVRYLEDLPTVMADGEYQVLRPTMENRFSLSPVRTSRGYSEWPSLSELVLMPPASGPAERRGMALIDGDRDKLAERMREYFSDVPDDILAVRYPSLMPRSKGKRNPKGFNASKVRADLRRHFHFDPARILPYPIRPFDQLWAYLENLRPLFKEPSPELQELQGIGNAFLVVREPNERAASGLGAWFSPYICDYDLFAGNSRHFPLYIDKSMIGAATAKRRRGGKKLLVNPTPLPNLSTQASAYLAAIEPEIKSYEEEAQAREIELGGGSEENVPLAECTDRVLWHHILAVLFTPAYNSENGEALRRDWPRIPIPCWNDPEKIEYRTSLKTFSQTGKLIAEILSMLPMDSNRWPDLACFAKLSGQNNVAPDDCNLTLADYWTIRTKVNAVRPGKGSVTQRPYSAKEYDALAASLVWANVVEVEVERVFGTKAVDIHMNDEVQWRGVPEKAWEFEIGGHKVLRKWLSYRTGGIVKRSLTLQECEVFSDIVRRVLVLIALGARLDYVWPRLKAEGMR